MADVTNSNLFRDTGGIQKIKDALVVLVKTEWNAAVVNELETGCLQVFAQHQVASRTLTVPGAVEIPFAIQQYWKINQNVSCFIALGCIVRGDTPHFEYVCQSVTYGISQLNTLLPVPIIFGVLTVNNNEQAAERIGGRHGHKGEEAALTAIKMMLLNQEIIKGNI